jgi:hypothetical protein
MSFEPIVLDQREMSSMVSTWDEQLVLKQDSEGRFYLAICQQEVLGSIYDLPEDERYDSQGETVVPETFEGQPVVGLSDGEWLRGPGLEETDASRTFESGLLSVVDEFLAEHEWPASSAAGSIREAVEAAITGVRHS